MASTNYIKRLESDRAAGQQYRSAIESALTEIRAYISSDKFANDPTVQVKDIDTRILEALRAADEAWLEAL